MIILAQIGNPKDNLNRRCEVVLKTYGRTPIRLREIMRMNKALKIEANPFIFAAKVRFACSFIIEANEAVTQVPRLGLSQRIG
jgi:hypothetical protein